MQRHQSGIWRNGEMASVGGMAAKISKAAYRKSNAHRAHALIRRAKAASGGKQIIINGEWRKRHRQSKSNNGNNQRKRKRNNQRK
jgi:hypothetical protein